jgi:hypothetical protein
MKALALSLLLATAPLSAETVLERPEITIGFDDDASSLVITAQWNAQDGSPRRETFSLGKDLHVIMAEKNGEWEKTDEEFRSKNWEAFLLPDASGFLLMEREYDGHQFENISLRVYEYFPQRRIRSLRLANGSPYWSRDGKQLALVESNGNRVNVVVYDIQLASVTAKKAGLSEDGAKALIGDFLRARVCDDEVPCESAPSTGKNKPKTPAKPKGKK